MEVKRWLHCYIRTQPAHCLIFEISGTLARGILIREIWSLFFGQGGVEATRIRPTEMKLMLNRAVAVSRGKTTAEIERV